MYNFKVLECDGKDCKVLFVNMYTPSASFEHKLLKSHITDAFRTGGCTIDGKKLDATETKPTTKPTTPTKQTPADTETEAEETQTATGGCSFGAPAGKNSPKSKPSAELFKRVIFDFYEGTANGRKVGIVYQTFTLGKTYVNRLTNAGLLHDGAPQGATIYTVKTKFKYCDQYTDSTIRWGYDAQYSCFKDKFGEWVCPSDATKITEQTYLPNK